MSSSMKICSLFNGGGGGGCGGEGVDGDEAFWIEIGFFCA